MPTLMSEPTEVTIVRPRMAATETVVHVIGLIGGVFLRALVIWLVAPVFDFDLTYWQAVLLIAAADAFFSSRDSWRLWTANRRNRTAP